jgi:hypothetical protein
MKFDSIRKSLEKQSDDQKILQPMDIKKQKQIPLFREKRENSFRLPKRFQKERTPKGEERCSSCT